MVLVHLTTGVRELDIVANINKRIICASCGQLSLDPHLMSCGNVLCPKCLTTSRGNACPCGTVCGHPFSFKNFELQVLNLMVKCPNFSNGCVALVPMRCVEEHLEKCEKSLHLREPASPLVKCPEYDAEIYKIVDNLADAVCVALDLGYPFNFETLPTSPPPNSDPWACSRKVTLPPMSSPPSTVAVRPPAKQLDSTSAAANPSSLRTQSSSSPNDCSQDNSNKMVGKAPAPPVELEQKSVPRKPQEKTSQNQTVAFTTDETGKKQAPSSSDAVQSAVAQKPNGNSPTEPASSKCKTHHRKMRENDNLYMDEGVLKLLESGVSGRTRRIQKSRSPEMNEKGAKRDAGRVSPTVKKSNATSSTVCLLKKYSTIHNLKPFKVIVEPIPDDILAKHLAANLELEKSKKSSKKAPTQPVLEANTLDSRNQRPTKVAGVADGQSRCPSGVRDEVTKTKNPAVRKVSTPSLQKGVSDTHSSEKQLGATRGAPPVKSSRESLVVIGSGNNDGGQQKPEISSTASPLSGAAVPATAAVKPTIPIGSGGWGNQAATATPGQTVRCQPPKLVAQKDPKKLNAESSLPNSGGGQTLSCDSIPGTSSSLMNKDRREISQIRGQKNAVRVATSVEDSSNIQKASQPSSESRQPNMEQQTETASSKASPQLGGVRNPRTVDGGDAKTLKSQPFLKKQSMSVPRKPIVKPVVRPSSTPKPAASAASATTTGIEQGKVGDKGPPERTSDQRSSWSAPTAPTTCSPSEEKSDAINRTMSFKIPRKLNATPTLNPPATPADTSVLQKSVPVPERPLNRKRVSVPVQVERKRCRLEEPPREVPESRPSSAAIAESANILQHTQHLETPAQLRELHSESMMSVEPSFELHRGTNSPTVPVIIPLEPQVAVKENVPQPYQHRLIERPVLELGTFSLKQWRDQEEEPLNSNVKDVVSRCSSSPPPLVSQPWNPTSSSAFSNSMHGKGNQCQFEPWLPSQQYLEASSQLISVQNQRRGIESMVTTSLPPTRVDPRRSIDPRSGAVAAAATTLVQKPTPPYLSGGYGTIIYQRGMRHLSASWLGDAVPETSSFWSSRS